jgi:hypothetical protein
MSTKTWPTIRVQYARSFLERLFGLRRSTSGGLLMKTKSVHGFGMIDAFLAVSLDRDFRVIESRVVNPGRIVWFGSATYVLELPANVEPPPMGATIEVTDV